MRSEKSGSSIGGDLMRRNWILKLALYSIKYDVKQTHMLNLEDDGTGMGDFTNIKKLNQSKMVFLVLKVHQKGDLSYKKFI